MGHSAQPFRMDNLLAEMWDLEGRVGPVRSPPVAQLTNSDEDVKEWAQQYIDAGKHFEVLVSNAVSLCFDSVGICLVFRSTGEVCCYSAVESRPVAI